MLGARWQRKSRKKTRRLKKESRQKANTSRSFKQFSTSTSGLETSDSLAFHVGIG
jgi:hypothetical protein